MWQTRLVPGFLPNGTPIISIIAKETYSFEYGRQATVDTDSPINIYEEDSFFGSGDPLVDAVKHESDLVSFKPLTDVIFIGNALVANGKKARYFDLTVSVDESFKTIRVFGNRKVEVKRTGISFTEPELFEEMPLNYSLAYGGQDIESDLEYDYCYAKNPVGKGFIVKKNLLALHMMELPNLEDPNHLLTPKNIVLHKHEKWKTMPEPCAFGYVSKNSWPRSQKGFQPIEKTPTEQIATTPGFIHPSFYNGATPLFSLAHLQGGEEVTMMYMDKEYAKFNFTLPKDSPTVWLDTGSGSRESKTHLQTVEVYKSTNQVTMLWRGSFIYPGPDAFKEYTTLKYGVI